MSHPLVFKNGKYVTTDISVGDSYYDVEVAEATHHSTATLTNQRPASAEAVHSYSVGDPIHFTNPDTGFVAGFVVRRYNSTWALEWMSGPPTVQWVPGQ